MLQLRTSLAQDVSQLKALWKLAFGDEDAYIDHFFTRYYTPERMLVLVENGMIRAMTAWFDMPLIFADGNSTPCAYLYAVATHPDCRGKGFAGQLLRFADQWLEKQGFSCITTVPARPDLHLFFAQNGFEECFALEKQEYIPQSGVDAVLPDPVTSEEYCVLRERFLSGRDHIAYASGAMDYQAGVCALSGGGLYRLGETSCACVECSGDEVFVKELLCPEKRCQTALASIAKQHPAQRYWVRTPYENKGTPWDFAMLKWLTAPPEWKKGNRPYLGLAFD